MIYSIERTHILPLTPAQAWDFFSSPANLPAITPPDLAFRVTSPLPEKMYAGLIITYTIRPFGGLLLRWVTEITHVRDGEYFVDEQRFGPYAFWHHQHFFRGVSGGTEMRDLVHYRLPAGLLGRIVHTVLVRRQLESIFDYRRSALNQLFPRTPAAM